MFTYTYSLRNTPVFFEDNNLMSDPYVNYFDNKLEIINPTQYQRAYVRYENQWYSRVGNSSVWRKEQLVPVGFCEKEANVTSLQPKTAFRAADYSDIIRIEAEAVKSSNLKTINNNSLIGSGNITINSGPITSLCTSNASTTSTATSSKPAVVVQNYRNGKNWYRVWSDGWIEQGGMNSKDNTTVNLLKPFQNTNYGILYALDYGTGSPAWNEYTSGKTNNNRTTTSFTTGTRVGNWYAFGY